MNDFQIIIIAIHGEKANSGKSVGHFDNHSKHFDTNYTTFTDVIIII